MTSILLPQAIQSISPNGMMMPVPVPLSQVRASASPSTPTGSYESYDPMAVKQMATVPSPQQLQQQQTISVPIPVAVPSPVAMMAPSPVSMEGMDGIPVLPPPTPAEERERKLFMQELNKFMSEIGKPLSKIPIMGYKELDLFQLFKEVTSYGGFNEVVKNVGTWSKIWKRLGNFDPSITDSSFRLKKNYERYLLEYEYKCYPDHKQQAIELEKQMQLRKSQGDTSALPPQDKMKAEKQAKRKSAVNTKDIQREKNGAVKMPLVLGELTVDCLGTIYPRVPYVTEKHIWPVGFVSSRTFSSMINPDQRVKYTSQIIDGGDKPQFVVTASDDEANPIISHSPSGAWRTVLKRIMEKTGSDDSRKHISVSGTLRFGLAHPVVALLIRELPNMDKVREIIANVDSPSTTRKRKPSLPSSSSSSDDSSEEQFEISSPKLQKSKAVLKPIDYDDWTIVKAVHFATREDIDDLDLAVATLDSLKFCAVH